MYLLPQGGELQSFSGVWISGIDVLNTIEFLQLRKGRDQEQVIREALKCGFLV